ncbi:MAG: hypothetical protein ABSA75_11795 [Candidatus Bathyarchaeia archaeon]|jgi:TRAP-type mannitol/chloroaromatic compound transport system permease small subunit
MAARKKPQNSVAIGVGVLCVTFLLLLATFCISYAQIPSSELEYATGGSSNNSGYLILLAIVAALIITVVAVVLHSKWKNKKLKKQQKKS